MSFGMLHDEREVCLEREGDDQSGLEVAVRRSWRCSKPAASALGAVAATLLLGVGVLVKSSTQQHPHTYVAPRDAIRENAEASCELWYEKGNDCSKPAQWTCENDDGSFGFQCCCNRWGTFDELTGMIALADHPEFCMDITMPYVGTGSPWRSSAFVMNSCYWGNPNKHWHLDPKGVGTITWASHKEQCLMVNGPGISLNRGPCAVFDYGPAKKSFKPHPIKMKDNPTQCLEVAGGTKDTKPQWGAPLAIQPCVKGKSSQQFKMLTFQPPKYPDVPSLFCVSVMLPWGYEKALLRWQHAQKDGTGVGIFRCNDFAVYSNESIVIQEKTKDLEEVKTTVMEGNLEVKFGGKWNTALNTGVFIRFWARMMKDSRTWRNEWTVKIDPDAVFFPSRLREMLRHKWWSGVAGCDKQDCESKPVYLNNCHRGMHGPIEVISLGGLKAYNKSWERCREDAKVSKIQQEDFYYRKCWDLLGVKKQEAYNLLFENLYACDERSDTRDGRHPCFSRQVSFHPFKTTKGYEQCHKRGESVQWVADMVINEENPGHSNYHHA
jgi:hypothetical protein